MELMRRALLPFVCGMICLAAAGCGRDKFGNALDKALEQDTVTTIGVIGVFGSPGNHHYVERDAALAAYLAKIGDGKYTVITIDTAVANKVLSVVVQPTSNFADAKVVAKIGKAFGFKIAVIGEVMPADPEKLAVRAIQSLDEEVIAAGEIPFEAPSAALPANVRKQTPPPVALNTDIKRFFIGHINAEEVAVTLDVKNVLPSSSTEAEFLYTMNAPDSRQDGKGKLYLMENIVELEGLGVGIIYVNADGKIVLESADNNLNSSWLFEEVANR
ncbi:MAG: hypothetical protein BWY06_02793 [Candidatus Latescibacteria bacterium ADurb.Bin168]|nr:MAG: hypothetical protein BWY06_02793 [Candidatus Latescibacteria bacterium ADurb.Bin168]